MASKLIVNEIEHTDGSGTAVTVAKATIADATLTSATATLTAGTLGSGVTGSPTLSLTNATFPAGHVLQVSATSNRTTATTTGADVPTACTHGITVTAGNDILVMASIPYRFTSGGSSQNYISSVFFLRHSTTVGGSFTGVATSPSTGARQRAYIDNLDGTNVAANFYMDDTISFNFLDESVSGTTHFYKIFMDGDGGTTEISYNDTYSTMTLMEIQS
jgi:hypothetical protein